MKTETSSECPLKTPGGCRRAECWGLGSCQAHLLVCQCGTATEDRFEHGIWRTVCQNCGWSVRKKCEAVRQLETMVSLFCGDGLTDEMLTTSAGVLYRRVKNTPRGQYSEANIYIGQILSEGFTEDGVTGHTMQRAMAFLADYSEET